MMLIDQYGAFKKSSKDVGIGAEKQPLNEKWCVLEGGGPEYWP